MKKSKKSIAKIILAIMVIFALAVPMSGIAFAAEDTAVLLSDETAAPVAESEAPAEEAPAEEAPAEEAAEKTNKYEKTFWALVPPIIAIGLALITKEVYSSLLVGIIFGALLSTSFNITNAIDNLVNQGFISAVSDTAGIFIFLVLLGIVVALVNKCGGSYAFGQWAQKHVKSKTGALLASFVLGCLIFIDDYFNCLTVGSVMRPVTDAKGISRAKLAYIIDATAAPICMIAPISSWAAAVSEFAEGTGLNGYELFIKAIPYNFYSLLTIGFVVMSTLMKVDFGSMKLHEANAAKGDLFTTGDRVEAVEDEPNAKGKIIDLALPILVLIVACVAGLLYVGQGDDIVTIQDMFANTDATVGLPLGAFVATVIIVIYLVARRVIGFKEAMECVPKGFIAMVPAILILTFATALKNMTGLLGASTYVHDLMEGAAEGLANFLPAIIFLVACLLSFATGTSWGTFGILIPIVISVFGFEGGNLTIIGISACMAGAVCGDHCSPISDTTIMASAGAQSNHINHVSTQLPYAITVAIVSFIAYVITGFVQNAWIMLPVSILMMIVTIFVIKACTKAKN